MSQIRRDAPLDEFVKSIHNTQITNHNKNVNAALPVGLELPVFDAIVEYTVRIYTGAISLGYADGHVAVFGV